MRSQASSIASLSSAPGSFCADAGSAKLTISAPPLAMN